MLIHSSNVYLTQSNNIFIINKDLTYKHEKPLTAIQSPTLYLAPFGPKHILIYGLRSILTVFDCQTEQTHGSHSLIGLHCLTTELPSKVKTTSFACMWDNGFSIFEFTD